MPGAEEDPYVQQLHSRPAAENLDIEFTGPVPPAAVVEFLSRARVAVVPSVWEEPAGLTLLEAMASPAAVVASRVGGMPEMSKAGGVIFVPPSDPQSLRGAVDDLLADEMKRKLVASKGRDETAGRSWEDVYADLTAT
ncbi:hypothetical protein NicSoilB11_31510 [Arthrobacter sp. NicSoilB11]|nr:hypothetical protein NicSoilB11_31510 [Arthrobacter sp. NicSoilB11]